MSDYTSFYEKHLGKIRWGNKGNGSALCPFHEDKNPSLSVNRENGLFCCFGCGHKGTAQDFARRLGVDPPRTRKEDPVAVYDYKKDGKLLYQVVRFAPKRFLARRPDDKGGWIWKAPKDICCLYNQDLLKTVENDFVLIPEGEKDCDTLTKLAYAAVTNPFGAKGWEGKYAEHLRGLNCVILLDNDAPGGELAERKRRDLLGIANRVIVLDLPLVDRGEDITDWLQKGHTKEELDKLIVEQWDRATRAQESGPQAVDPSTSTTQQNGEPKAPDVAPELPFPQEAWVGVFEEYRQIVAHCTVAPDEYHWACLIQLIGLTLGRQLYVQNPARLYANFYILLIGPAGRNKKSTCLGFTEELARLIGEKLRLIRHPSSLEGIYKVLAEKPGTRALIFQDEFKGLLAASHRAATGNLLSGLNTLFACPLRDSLTRKDTVTIEETFVSLLTGAPQRWIEEAFEAGDFTGGFMSRVMVLTGSRKPPIPRAPAPDAQRLQELATTLRALTEKLPKDGLNMEWSTGGLKLWNEWFLRHDAELDRMTEQQSLLCVRIPDYVLKIAMIYSVVASSQELTEKAIAIAIKIGEYLKAHTLQLFGGVAFTRSARLEQRLLAIVKRKPGATKREMQREIGGDADAGEFNRALENLVQAERLESHVIVGSTGQHTTGYRLPE